MTTTHEPARPGAPASKRSQTVSLALLAGAGAVALTLGRIDPTQREEDVLVYADPEACVAGRIRSEGDCRRDHAIARERYPEAAPRYATLAECGAHHGPGRCLSGEAVSASASGRFVPMMAGYVIGRRADQDLEPQPVYDHQPEAARAASSGGGGGGYARGAYCTSWGGRIATSSGGASASARVSSAAVRPAAFGGFGSTGRGFASHGSSHGGGG